MSRTDEEFAILKPGDTSQRHLYRKRTLVCCTSCVFICSVLTVIVVVILSFCKICVGATHLNICPRYPTISIYLVVSGFAPVLFCSFCKRNGGFDRHPAEGTCNVRNLLCFFSIAFNIGWLALGSVWIFDAWKGVHFSMQSLLTNHTDACKTCPQELLTFSYYVTITDWSIFILSVILYYVCSTVISKI